MKIESNKNWTTCLRLNTGDGSPRVFLLNSHFLGSVPLKVRSFYTFQFIELDSPVSVTEDWNNSTVFTDTVNVHFWSTDHEVYVNISTV